ncbi:MAG TPA: hypothetical protein VII23_20130 [Terriglobales bacterium]
MTSQPSRRGKGFVPPILLVLMVLTAYQSFAIPAFSRQYGTSCSTCHIDFPKLNDFGKAFKDAGFKFPKDDESMLKIPPVMLGAPANSELWPKAIWPGSIPGLPPIGLRYNNYMQFTSGSRNNFNNLLPPGSIGPFVPTADFQTGLFSIFTAGNFGSDIAFWVDDDISVSGANANGGLGEAYLKFVNVGRFLKLPENVLNLRVGQMELDIPFTQSKSIWVSPYDIYTQANVGVVNPAFNQQFVNNSYTLAGAGQGIEFSGGRHTGGYNYSLAFINQNTSGVGQDANSGSPYIPQATGSNNGGVGVSSDANFKDIYASFNYRFNLEKSKESRNSIQAAGPSGPRDHTYLNFGTYYFYGRSVQRLSGTTLAGTSVVLTAREPFYRVGGNFTFNYHNVQINGLYMYGHDYNLLPIDSNGSLIPLPVSDATPVGFVHGSPVTFSGGFVDAEWLAYPWMYVMVRYDGVNSTSDYYNALVPGGFTGSSFNGASSVTRNRITPAVQFLIHANIKAIAEYQFRPGQSVTMAVNPINGLPMAVNSFHTNTLVLGFEFAY